MLTRLKKSVATKQSQMSSDKVLVIVIGVGLIIFTYWFFLGKADRSKNEEHHH